MVKIAYDVDTRYEIYKSISKYKGLVFVKQKYPCYIGVSKLKLNFIYTYCFEHFYYHEVLWEVSSNNLYGRRYILT